MRVAPSIAGAVCALAPEQSWLRLVAGLRARRGFWWLDSALPGGELGRFSFAGAEPWAVTRIFVTPAGREARCETECFRAGLTTPPAHFGGDPLAAIRALLPAREQWSGASETASPSGAGARIPPSANATRAAELPFAGGVVAALGYELAGAFEPSLPAPQQSETPALPDATLLGVDRLYAWDHAAQRGFGVALAAGRGAPEARARAESCARALVRDVPDAPFPAPARALRPAEFAARFRALFASETAGASAAHYARAVSRVREHIIAGDVYQACLSRRIAAPFDADAWALYASLRAHNPAPFAAYLELPDFTWLGASPERFLRASAGGALESRPIKGTRPRGKTPATDRALARSLEASAKDRAENLMIVDLLRNDLGRVATPGSVRVSGLFELESYASVFQLVSTVRARLRPDATALDALRAAFPPGSMTGAPKLAAMSLLRALEPVRRGPYAGALGYFDARGGCDLSVVIRSAFVRAGKIWLHTGGGVVYDSDPQQEWDETRDKARALLEAIAGSAPA